MVKRPDIAVLLPVYNPGKGLLDTLVSLQKDTFPHDIFVIDDGSDVKVETLLKENHLTQKNIFLITLPHNGGITKALNAGIQVILEKGYTYIARIDAGDICFPERLKKQIHFMEGHKDVGIVGTGAQVINEKGKVLFYIHHPAHHAGLIKKLCYDTCFVHPSMMIRASALKEIGGYDEDFKTAQDYELAVRMSKRYRLANIAEDLIGYLYAEGGISATKRKQQCYNRIVVQLKYFDYSNVHAYVGVLRSIALYLIPRNVLDRVKRWVYR